MSLFGSLIDLTTDVVRVVAAPVEAVVDLAGAVVKPIADVAEDLVSDIKSIKD
jgi:hypothetical protein